MREIKFRALDKVNKCFYYYDLIRYATPFSNSNIDMSTVEQFTGLKDKNGVEIYEGDIIQHNDFVGYVKYINKGNCNVLGYALSSLINNRIFYMFCDEIDNYKVIGNIYENKELLK